MHEISGANLVVRRRFGNAQCPPWFKSEALDGVAVPAFTPWIQDSLNGRKVWVRGVIEADGLPTTLIFTPPEFNYEFLSYTLTVVVE